MRLQTVGLLGAAALGLAAVVGAPAMAQHYSNQYPNRPILTCETYSNGLNFTHESRDAEFSRQTVVYNCRTNGRTANSQCDANVFCHEGSQYNPMIRCETFSRGLSFANESISPDVARQGATYACRVNGRTMNSECEVNVTCHSDEDRYGGGYPIVIRGGDPNQTPVYRGGRNGTVIIQDGRGGNGGAVIIHDGRGRIGAPVHASPLRTCSTISRGVSFTENGYDMQQTRNSVIRQCQADHRTEAWQCERSTVCRAGSAR